MQNLRATIEGEIQNEKVLVYSKSYCPYCVQAKNLLSAGGVAFKAVELDQVGNGSAIQNTLKDITNQRTVPNIFIGGKHIGGCSDLQGLSSQGKLAEKLSAAGVSHSF